MELYQKYLLYVCVGICTILIPKLEYAVPVPFRKKICAVTQREILTTQKDVNVSVPYYIIPRLLGVTNICIY